MSDTSEAQRKLAAIMFTDMVGYSALAQRNEARAIELLEEHRRVVRGVLTRHGGREVKTTGDGFLIEFPSALAAVQGAVEIQQAMHERNQAAPADRQVNIRIGVHLGDVILSHGDIHGDGVNIAARLEPLAAPGGICISSAVWEQVRNKVDHPLALLGPAELKNIELPVVVHRVVMPWESGAAATAAPGARPSRAPWIAGIAALAVLAVLLVGMRRWRLDRAHPQSLKPPGAILFETGFEAPDCELGLLANQDGWAARGGFSSSAAMVVASKANQFISISGARMEQINSNLWSAWYVHPLPNNPAATNTLRASVEADFDFDPGSLAPGTSFLASMLLLNDGRSNPFAAVGLNKLGMPFGQNFAHPNQYLSTNRGTNAVHRVRLELDFGSRVATFLVNGRVFGTAPINPKSGARLESVSIVLQADHAVNSTLRVDNLTVRAEAGASSTAPENDTR